jgi:hypothetical protein
VTDSDMPSPAATPPRSNAFRDRLWIVLVAATVFIVLLIATAVTESNLLGTIVAAYGIVGGILLGLLLAKAERTRAA